MSGESVCGIHIIGFVDPVEFEPVKVLPEAVVATPHNPSYILIV